jgi:hypothetical protein
MTRLVAIVIVLTVAPAAAQTVDAARLGRVEMDVGGGWLGGAQIGSGDANLRAATATPTPFRLFSVDSRVAAGPTVHVKAGYALTRRFMVEGGLTLSHPELRSSVSNDVEAAPPITIAERVDQYGIDASLVVMIHELAIGGRTLPFVSGGAGYLRQLHEGQTVVEQGHLVHAGGGVKHWLLARERGFLNGAGVRVDARLYLISGGIAFEDRPRPHGAASGSVFLAF